LNSQILILFLVLIANVSTLAEWSRLQIEQGWLADASRIEKTARGVLQMQQPAETHILVVRP